MAQEGLERVADAERLAVVGIAEVIAKLPAVWQAYRRILRAAEREKLSGAVLIDYPDFHLRLGAALARRGIPVVYYVSPQVWAWRPGRLAKMKKFLRRMITLFPFEAELYLREGIDAVCAGHPLADEVEARLKTGADAPPRNSRKRVVLMPGSRAGEVRRHWPVLREAARLLAQDREIETFVVMGPGLPRSLFPGADAAAMTIFEGTLEKLLASCDVLLVASGTSTLQGALCGAPMVVVYKTSALTFALARRLVKIPDVALANIVAGERVVPEILQEEATPERVATEAGRYLDDARLSEAVRLRWKPIWERLGPRDAAANAARAVLEALSG